MSRFEYELPEIPESWEWLTIGEVVQRVSNIKPESEPSRAFRYVDISSIDNRQQRVSETRSFYGADAPSRARRPVHPGDVLLSNVRVNLRNTAILEDDIADVCSTGFTVLRANGRVTPRYLFQYIRSDQFVKPLEDLQTGTQYPATSDRAVFEQPIPVPPVEMQNELTLLIEEMDRRVKSVRERLSKVPLLLKRFRQAVLAAACAGQLTSDWRSKNVVTESAELLLQRIQRERKLKSTEKPTLDEDLPPKWAYARIGQICDVATGATPLRTRDAYFGGTVPWITSSAVNDGLVTRATEFITDLAVKETNAKVFPKGTLIVAMYGEGQTRGRVAELGFATATNQALAALLFRGANLECKAFLKLHFLKNYEAMRTLAAGGVQPNLSLGLIRNSEILLPPADEQAEIVRRVGSLFVLADSIESHLADATAQVELTTQAILAKAFRGELTQER